ncbi:unnamed protein product [Prorocentrum cordatum]|uniref:Uncharacterized protein n=1 Tax=Prorocentrum cordatum TaxID=2364126 RepID=A0ABN9VJQ7_9DINO|nr:unnamed protein product [Polarella glacialis]
MSTITCVAILAQGSLAPVRLAGARASTIFGALELRCSTGDAMGKGAAAKKGDAGKPKVEHSWCLDWDACECEQCEQNTHQLDRDSPQYNPHYLRRHKSRETPEGCKPSGKECSGCFGVRRVRCKDEDGNIKSMVEVKKEREKNPEFDEKWTKLRKDKVSGAKFENDAAKHEVTKADTAYEEDFDEGTRYSLVGYIRLRRQQHEVDMEDPVAVENHVTNVLQKPVVVDQRAGKKYVEVFDVDPDHEGVRFRRGRRHSAELTKKEGYDNKGDAKDRFQELESKVGPDRTGLRRLRGKAPAPMASGGPPLGGHGAAFEASDGESAAPPAQGKAACDILAGRASLSRRAPSPAPSLSPAAAGGGGRASAAGSARGLSPVQASATGRKRASSKQGIIEEAQGLLSKTTETQSWAKHWEMRQKTRGFEGLSTRLVTSGRSCGSFLGDSAANDASSSLFTLEERLRHRQQFFEKARTDFPSLCKGIAGSDTVKPIEEAPPQLLTSILTMCAQQSFVEPMRPDLAAAFGSFLKYRDGGISADGQLCMSALPGAAAMHAQRGLVLSFIERIFKLPEVDSIACATKVFECIGIDSFDPVNIDFKKEGVLPNGLFPQSCMDLGAVYFCGIALDAAKKGGELRGEAAVKVYQIVSAAGSLSARVKTHFRHLRGLALQHGHAAGDIMRKAHGEHKSRLDMLQTAEVSVAKAAAIALQTALEGPEPFKNAFDTVATLLNEEKTERDLTMFGSVFCTPGVAEGRGHGDVNPFELARQLGTVPTKAVEMALKSSGYNVDAAKRICAGTESNSEGAPLDEDSDELNAFEWQCRVLEVVKQYEVGNQSKALSNEAAAHLETQRMACELAIANRKGEKDRLQMVQGWASVWKLRERIARTGSCLAPIRHGMRRPSVRAQGCRLDGNRGRHRPMGSRLGRFATFWRHGRSGFGSYP